MLGVGVSNDEIAGAKAEDNASERDQARSVPRLTNGSSGDSGGSLGASLQVTLRDGCSASWGRGSQVNRVCGKSQDP